MLATRVGYAGGTKISPTYTDLGDHAECIEIDFDPAVISYRTLVNEFFASHNPCSKQWFSSRQYISLLLFRDEAQREAAESVKALWEEKLEKPITTQFSPFDKFYTAEDYHQKYYLKRYPKAEQLVRTLYPKESSFTNALLTARLNAVVKGGYKVQDIRDELPEWGLSKEAEQEIDTVLRKIRW
ncbi:peptide-methionine (S)-S-oxide reductase [Salsuginibacillus halophilus]|uniref:peptide-methionine (S)-S-oxide reductase n=1 Tax=Salsuginibacillus halophilus TaxID=517424 RepID=A0A2P8H3T9_9BACI|nr:peptide-methionine (S)-S-oxide reductase [Salsuginibacillus halophilus]